MGERFGRYQLLKLAGMGGMAQVHIARQVGPQGFVKPCVLKRISLNFAGDQQVRKMFLEEARISALLNHPHIVQTFDYGEVDGTPYLAMELVDGVNLAQLCKTLAKEARWLPLRSCVEICVAVSDALAYAHEFKDLDGRNIHLVHRDVSPQNILVSRQGGVKLADFGIARHDARDTVTVGPSAKGKPGYMSPEQAMGGEVDARADIYALGVVLTELMSARRVIRSGQAVTGLLAVSKRVRELVELRADAPAELKELALAMTSLEPDDRPKSAREIAEQLRRAAGKIREKNSLTGFLEKVFAKYFPADVLGANTMTPSGPTGFDPVDPNATSERKEDNDPTKIDPPAKFEDDAWAKSQPADPGGAASVYEQGWPEEYLKKDEAPKLELIARSSSVDAMKFFKATGSSQDIPQPAPSPSQSPGSTPTGLKPILGTPKDPPPGDGPRPWPKVLQVALEETHEPPKKSEIWKYVPLVAMSAAVALVGFGVLWVASRRGSEENGATAVEVGTVRVSSSPLGATIVLDGQRTKHTTPHELKELPLDRPIRLSVVMDGHLTIPVETMVVIPAESKYTTANFTLKRGRVFQLVTTPSGANVEMNGQRLSSITPLDLPAIPYGETATLAISLEGHLSATLSVKSVVGTATVVTATFEAARQVDIASDPPGAKVFIDNTMVGTTPIYDLWVPEKRPFKLRMERKGFKTHKESLNPKKMTGRQIEVELTSLPLLAMPMSKEERAEAKDLDRKTEKMRIGIRLAKAALAKAEKKLAAVESQPNILIGPIAEAQREVEDARTKIEDLENAKIELENQVDMFRQRIMARLEGPE